MTVKKNVPGSRPDLELLLQATGPLDLEAVLTIGKIPRIDANLIDDLDELSDEGLTRVLYAIIWIIRGRNGWLRDGQTDYETWPPYSYGLPGVGEGLI